MTHLIFQLPSDWAYLQYQNICFDISSFLYEGNLGFIYEIIYEGNLGCIYQIIGTTLEVNLHVVTRKQNNTFKA